MALLDFFGILFLISLLTYLIPNIWIKFRPEQNLKEKYNATWALVTGGSSGIGKALVEKLAGQGLNVVVVAYPDAVLDKAMTEYENKFQGCKFIKVGINLAAVPSVFMPELVAKTKDVTIQCIINNAGYIKTGFYNNTSFEAQLANHNCNATSVAAITHHFTSILIEKKLKGCVTFTSSPAGFMPCPFSVMYGATKSYLTLFAMSLAPELGPDGIDVCVVHPSPVNSSFYEKAHMIDALKFFKSTATGPETIANAVVQSVGRVVVRDQGYYPIVVKLLLKIIELNFLAELMTIFAPYMGDYKALKGKKEELKKGN